MRVTLLGPLRVEDESGEVVLGAAKERSLIAVLALSAGSVVGADRLIDALWGDAPPATARKTLQTYVSNIRRSLGADAVTTEGSGYALRVALDDVDVGRFRRLVREGQDALRSGSTDSARGKFGEAIALWHGDPFAGVGSQTGLAAEAVRLREEYLSALEASLAADLAAGCHAERIGELESLVREHPYRERLWAHLIVALYRSGRQADALAAYQRARTRLRDELGLEPGGELRRLEQAVLAHDASLDATASAVPAPAASTVRVESPVLRSPVRYAVCPDGVHVAYQIVGDGPIDVLAVPGFVSHLDMWWDAPTDRLVRRLSAFCRLILFDKRGMGLSDRPAEIDAEQWGDDVQAVLEAAGSERAVILGISAGSPTALVFAAAHPERTRALILCGGYARVVTGDGYDLGFAPDVIDGFITEMEAKWGTSFGLDLFAPSRADDPAAQGFWARCQTISASPAAAATYLRALAEIDVRHALPTIAVPTLILHATRDQNVPVEAARLCRDLIPGAALVELDSDIHLIWLSDVVDDIAREIEAFIDRTVPSADVDRVLATVLAVASSPVSPRRDAEIDAVVERCRGVIVGNGLATFDGPARAIRCARALVSEIGSDATRPGVAVHSGECQRLGDAVRGVAVDIARELAGSAESGQVLVSQTVRDLVVGSTIEFRPHAPRSFRGVPGEWDVFEVVPPGVPDAQPS
ncbi:MAG TPA: alpha/beta fold hydrolase [Acidimicrobiia bacterium]|nr:alpha/beta fold hydrolase [Acidimicrobiia bacterium]